VSAPAVRGFGTVLIKQSLQAHGGEACVRYDANGVTCEIRLPLAEGTDARRSAHCPAHVRTKAAASSHPTGRAGIEGKHILVIEDEPLIWMDVVASLREAGCDVVGPAGTLDQAKQLIEDADFDVALVDANLAGHPVDELAVALTRRALRLRHRLWTTGAAARAPGRRARRCRKRVGGDQHVIVLRRQQACTCIGLLVVIRLLPVIFYSERLNCRRT
jgi:CheY-like chemotaxis protein